MMRDPEPAPKGITVQQRAGCTLLLIAAVTCFAVFVGATIREYVCLLVAAEAMCATTRLVCGAYSPIGRSAMLTLGYVAWVFVSGWIALVVIFAGNLPLLATTFFLAYCSVPEMVLQARNPASDLYQA